MTMGEITNITRIDIEGKAAALIACDATAAQERLSHAHNVSGGDWHGDCCRFSCSSATCLDKEQHEIAFSFGTA